MIYCLLLKHHIAQHHRGLAGADNVAREAQQCAPMLRNPGYSRGDLISLNCPSTRGAQERYHWSVPRIRNVPTSAAKHSGALHCKTLHMYRCIPFLRKLIYSYPSFIINNDSFSTKIGIYE